MPNHLATLNHARRGVQLLTYSGNHTRNTRNRLKKNKPVQVLFLGDLAEFESSNKIESELLQRE
jgi:metallophosphoesterase superfamily enzyme